ncbi:energy-coupling factor ABC transporter substrate-binding protein [Cohnella boryungensis]|uniref:Cobalt transport protein CbiN n=1 Tax=Cohnella boryungensis TaxID=768479 RepID=A0ABV8SG20_9BACL
MKTATKNVLIVAAVILLALIPLLFVNGEFGGADDAAEAVITEIHPTYEPWFSSFFELPGETESMLFALQAALGAGVIGYAIGYLKGKSKNKTSNRDKDNSL